MRWRGFSFFFILTLVMLACAPSAQAQAWHLSGKGVSGSVEVKASGRITLAAMDQIAGVLGYTVKPQGTEEAVIQGPRVGLKLVRGAAVVWIGYSVTALSARARFEQGHWWVESESALRVMNQFLKRNGRNITLKWAGTAAPQAPPEKKPEKRPEKKPEKTPDTALPKLKDLRWGGGGDSIRIVADLADKRTPQYTVGKKSVVLNVAPIDKALIKRLVSHNSEIALDAEKAASGMLAFHFDGWNAKVFCLEEPHRCVIDLKRAPASKPPAPEKKRADSPAPKRKEEPKAPAPPAKNRKKLVVIDAGHGGKDPGAVYRRYTEKTIALQISKRVESELKQRGVNVRMTRSGDTYPTLRERTSMANEWNADVFLSIHLNALPRGRHASGMEIYIMALPTDRDAMELAKIENAEIAEGGASGADSERTSMLLSILGNMQQNVKISESTLLAEDLFSSGVKRGINMRRVAQAPFWVLRGAAMPAVLIETGFITELSEAKLLSTSAYQKKMASAIADGVMNFLKRR